MLKQSITYEDFNGDTRTEDFYFNLTKAEVAELELTTKGGLVKHLQDIVASEDGAAIVKQFKDIVLMAYGEKSDDGRRFIKTEELRLEFQQTNAYSELFMLLATDADAASKFMNGVVPQIEPQDHLSKQAETPAIAPTSTVVKEDGMAEYLAWKAQQTTPGEN